MRPAGDPFKSRNNHLTSQQRKKSLPKWQALSIYAAVMVMSMVVKSSSTLYFPGFSKIFAFEP